MTTEAERAWRYALRLLKVRARSTQEMAARLRRHQFSSPVISETLSRLTADGLLDDVRFARWWAEARQRQGRGPRLVRYELRQKGLAPAVIAGALEAVPLDESAAARALAVQRLPRLAGLPRAAQYRRLTQWLARRGFEPTVIREVVEAAMRPYDDPTP